MIDSPNPPPPPPPLHRPEWCRELSSLWSSGIPISQKMGLRLARYDGRTLHLQASLADNLNVHQTMFAGSIYSQCVLAGWGLVWLQLKEAGMEGDIVLAKAGIDYLRPVTEAPEARVTRDAAPDALRPLLSGRSVKFDLQVQLFSGERLAAEMSGKYAVRPVRRPGH